MRKTNLFYFAFLALTLLFVNGVSFGQLEINFTQGLDFDYTSPISGVFDITSDGRRAVVLTNAETPVGRTNILVIDPSNGFVFDSKLAPGQGVIGAQIVETADGTRVVVLSRDTLHLTIYDLDQNGQLTLRATNSLPSGTQSSVYNHMAFSPLTRTGFLTVNVSGYFKVISFSLDNAAILDQIGAPVGTIFRVSEVLKIYEDAGRRIVVSGSNRTLVFIDASNPAQMQQLGTVQLPPAGSAGTYQMSVVFSGDGHYVFAGNGYSVLTAVDTTTRQIVGSLSDTAYRARQLKIFESGNTRYLAMRSIEDGGGAFKGISLIDASDPSQMSVVSRRDYGEQVFGVKDFAFTRAGDRLYIATSVGLTGVSIPDFRTVFDAKLPVQTSIKLALYQQPGKPERIFGAWGGAPYTYPGRLFSLPNRDNTKSNFDADGRSDISVFRPDGGFWYQINSATGTYSGAQFGTAEDIPVRADYDGDKKTDLAVYRPSQGNWYILTSATNSFRALHFGNDIDKPVPVDVDGDGKYEPSVFRSTLNNWYVLQSSDGASTVRTFAAGEGKPVAGDFDADGKTDLAVYYISGKWSIFNSANGSFTEQQFGIAEDIPLSGDWDNDGRSDLAVFRPSSGVWYIQKSFAGFSAASFGLSGDLPVPADYDGDGRTDIAVFRPNAGSWYILQSNNNAFTGVQFGIPTDIPLSSNY